jgi:hypothetical protein
MRNKLGKYLGERLKFTARVETFGLKRFPNFEYVRTILLIDISLASNSKVIADHLWRTHGAQMQALNLQAGDIISFEARVGKYAKAHTDGFWRFNLQYPSQVIRINKQAFKTANQPPKSTNQRLVKVISQTNVETTALFTNNYRQEDKLQGRNYLDSAIYYALQQNNN